MVQPSSSVTPQQQQQQQQQQQRCISSNNRQSSDNLIDPSQIIIERLLSKMADFHPLPSQPPEAAFSPAWLQFMQQAEQRAKTMEPAKLPSMDHLTYRDFEHVYEPSADTYLMLDAICYDLPLQQHASFRHILEIGCGSGLSIVYLAMQLQQMQGPQHQFLTMVTDVNPIALRVARRTARENGVDNEMEAIQCDLASALLPRCAHAVDVLVFNPPYVPTPDEEVGGTGIEASWAGGVRGRRVVDRALPQMAQLLRPPHGVAYLVTVDDNDPEQMAETALSQLGLVMRPVVRRKAHNEYLTVHRLSWKQESELI